MLRTTSPLQGHFVCLSRDRETVRRSGNFMLMRSDWEDREKVEGWSSQWSAVTKLYWPLLTSGRWWNRCMRKEHRFIMRENVQSAGEYANQPVWGLYNMYLTILTLTNLNNQLFCVSSFKRHDLIDKSCWQRTYTGSSSFGCQSEGRRLLRPAVTEASGANGKPCCFQRLTIHRNTNKQKPFYILWTFFYVING